MSAASVATAARVRLPGLAASVLVAAVATVLARWLPVVGSAVIGLVLGALVRLAVRPAARLTPGIRFASHSVLQLSVVLLGTRLSIVQVLAVGTSSLPVMLGTLAICLGAAWLLGRLLGVVGDLRTLIGVGTGICGASAIAATAPVIGAVGADVAYAVSTIFVFNIAAVVLFPLLGHLLGMGQEAFGLFAGTAVNDTSSVVAAASAYGPAAADHAVVVKLVRTLMIIPVALGLAALVARRQRAASGSTSVPAAPLHWWRLVPWFLVGFVLAALAGSGGLVPAAAQPGLSAAALFLIATALSAIGLSTDLGAFRRAGARPLLLGGLLWVTVSVASLALQRLSGGL